LLGELVAEDQQLTVRAVGENYRPLTLAGRSENVGAKQQAIVRWDRRVPFDMHPVTDFSLVTVHF
jgi:hypothetical protein